MQTLGNRMLCTRKPNGRKDNRWGASNIPVLRSDNGIDIPTTSQITMEQLESFIVPYSRTTQALQPNAAQPVLRSIMLQAEHGTHAQSQNVRNIRRLLAREHVPSNTGTRNQTIMSQVLLVHQGDTLMDQTRRQDTTQRRTKRQPRR